MKGGRVGGVEGEGAESEGENLRGRCGVGGVEWVEARGRSRRGRMKGG